MTLDPAQLPDDIVTLKAMVIAAEKRASDRGLEIEALKVLVGFDESRRPVRTFFESAPHDSHHELMEAAGVIKDCVAYGPKAQEERDKGGATSMIGK